MTETASDSIDTVLRSDHAAIKRALVELRTNPDTHAVGELFQQLTADIVRHFVAEEQYLLPAVRDHLVEGDAISEASFAQHAHIEKMLKTLDDDDTTDERVGIAVRDLETALDEHIRAQESDVLPALVKTIDAATLAELGEGVLGAEQLAPTHPRSFIPRSATLSKVTSWVTGLFEKSIDSREASEDD